MNFAELKAITIPEGNVKSISIGGQVVWNALKAVDKYSWEAVFASIDAGTYATDYAIGDLVPLDLGSEGLINMQIAAFDTDDLADGSGKAPITWIAKELLSSAPRMNPARVTNDDGTYQEGTGSIGGWEKCEMRTHLKETIKPLIPENVRNAIKKVTKTQPAFNTSNDEYTQTTEDDVWIPSYNELFTSNSLYYGLFQNTAANRVKNNATTGIASSYWLRDASYIGQRFTYVGSSGSTIGSGGMANNAGVYKTCLCFCT